MIRRFGLILLLTVGLLGLARSASATGPLVLLDTTTITTAVTSVTPPIVMFGDYLSEKEAQYLAVQGTFVYGSGGTNCTAYIQTSVDGLTWADIISFQWTTTSGVKVSAVHATAAVFWAAASAPTDGSLTANTILNGLIGDRIRVKYTTTGTYAGGTTLRVVAMGK